MSTIQGRLADGAHQTIGCSYRLDLRTETELWTPDMEFLFDDAYLSKGIDAMKSWFTLKEVLDWIYHQLPMVGCFIPPPQWCSSGIIGALWSPSVLLSLDCHFDISFSTVYCLHCRRFSSRLGAPQPPCLFHSQLFTSLPFRRCSAWKGCSAE